MLQVIVTIDPKFKSRRTGRCCYCLLDGPVNKYGYCEMCCS